MLRVGGRERAFTRLPSPDALAALGVPDVKGLEWRTRRTACGIVVFDPKSVRDGGDGRGYRRSSRQHVLHARILHYLIARNLIKTAGAYCNLRIRCSFR